MKQLILFAQGLLLMGAWGAAVEPAFDEKRPYGRIAWMVGTAETQRWLSEKPLKAGEKVTGHVDANSQCELLVVPLTVKERQVLATMRPVMLALEEWTEQALPPRPIEWAVPEAAVEIRVFFFAREHPQAVELRKLVAAMREAEPALLKAQTAKLRELLGKLAGGGPEHAAAPPAPAIGGTFRGAMAKWREHASRVNFSREKPGVLVFPCVPTTRSDDAAP